MMMDLDNIDSKDNLSYNNQENTVKTNQNDFNIFTPPRTQIHISAQNPTNSNNINNTGILSGCEGRIMNDISEFRRSKMIGKTCRIILHDYKRINNTDNFELLVEFVNIFTVKFYFSHKYPYEPPIIKYYSGQKFDNIFDYNGNVLLDSLKPERWSPVIWFSTLVFSIELLISNNLNNNYHINNLIDEGNNLTNAVFLTKKNKYGKRKWRDYLREVKDNYKNGDETIKDLEHNLKKLKIF